MPIQLQSHLKHNTHYLLSRGPPPSHKTEAHQAEMFLLGTSHLFLDGIPQNPGEPGIAPFQPAFTK